MHNLTHIRKNSFKYYTNLSIKHAQTARIYLHVLANLCFENVESERFE